jgi:UDP-N-acetylmuramoyl-L-alanyl-D-glutamate--2,6-diaminopimelate ligase
MLLVIRKIKNIYHLLKAIFWTYRCGYPAKKLFVIGVTGTDGKTTTCTLIYEILKAAGIKAGLLTTVSAVIGGEEIETGLHTTNPDPSLLQPILKKAVGQGATHMILEVTSHGLDQNRVWGCNFQIGVLTNITHEHLDYHGSFKKYREAKAKLMLTTQYSILNKDDSSYEWFKNRCKGKVIPYGGTRLKEISPALAGDYNKHNIAAAEAVCRILGIKQDVVARVIKEFRGVPGRREEVNLGQKFKVYVDFAHTPNALEAVLTQLKKELSKGKKLILVSGATGERDKEKRPMMGEIAARLADIMIITSDDTRSENQDEIAAQIFSGIPKTQLKDDKVFKENDRKKAIEMAIKMAKAGDIILLAGKGHEKTILLGKTEYPWSDAEVVRKLLSDKV